MSDTSVSETTLSESENEVFGSKKRKRNPESWKRQIIKQAKTRGKSYINSAGKRIESKRTGPPCGCKKQCTNKFSDEDKQTFITMLYNEKSKTEQDIFLQGLITKEAIKRHRKRSDDCNKPKAASFSYFVIKDGQRISVCKKGFISLFSLSNIRVYRLTSLLLSGKSPTDLRGKHSNRPHALNGELKLQMKQHIECFPYKTSHYSSKNVHYLDAKLNVKIMHSLFITKYPEIKEKIKYETYLKFFNENYCLKFGRPQVDVCSECERLGTILRDTGVSDHKKKIAAAELMVHKRRAKKFYTKLHEIQELCAEHPEIGAISFDYMQNLPLPEIPVQEMFYLRQLWMYAFEIHDLKTNTGHFYTYHEGQAHKGPDEVCSFIYDYVKSIPPEITELHLFSDSCPGQNRNHTMVRFLLALQASNRFQKIFHYFPLRGHSFLPCDRDFGTVKKVVRRHDRVYVPEQYEKIIIGSRRKAPFTLKTITHKDIIDFKNWWPANYKKTCKSVELSRDKTAETFALSNYREFMYDSSRPGYVTTKEYIDGSTTHTFKLSKDTKSRPTLPTKSAYVKPIPINYLKIANLRKVFQYLEGEDLEFYYHITSWETSNRDED